METHTNLLWKRLLTCRFFYTSQIYATFPLFPPWSIYIIRTICMQYVKSMYRECTICTVLTHQPLPYPLFFPLPTRTGIFYSVSPSTDTSCLSLYPGSVKHYSITHVPPFAPSTLMVLPFAPSTRSRHRLKLFPRQLVAKIRLAM